MFSMVLFSRRLSRTRGQARPLSSSTSFCGSVNTTAVSLLVDVHDFSFPKFPVVELTSPLALASFAAGILPAYGQNRPKTCPPADHLIIGFSGLLQRIAFNHGTNSSQYAKPQRILGIFGGTR